MAGRERLLFFASRSFSIFCMAAVIDFIASQKSVLQVDEARLSFKSEKNVLQNFLKFYIGY